MSPAAMGVVLVVDDNRDDRDYLISLLDDSGYPTHSASSGNACLDTIEHWDLNNTPLLAVVLSLVMPVLNGLEVLQEIRKDDKFNSTLVILLDGHGSGLLRECVARGANALLRKPVIPDALLAALPRVRDSNWQQ